MVPLSVAVALFVVVLPVARQVLLIWALGPLLFDRPLLQGARPALRWAERLRPWAMAEIFMVGVAVALVKLADLATLTMGPAFWSFAVIVVITAIKDTQLGRAYDMGGGGQGGDGAQADLVSRASGPGHPDRARGGPRRLPNLRAGPAPPTNPRCPRCGARLASRDLTSLQRVWAWLIAGMLTYIPANIWPMLITATLGRPEEATIVGGAIEIWHHGGYGVAAIVFVASILDPGRQVRGDRLARADRSPPARPFTRPASAPL